MRGGVLAEARAFERSARLTRDPGLRADRLSKAAGGWIKAGLTEHAVALLDEAMALDCGLRVHTDACA